MFGKSFHEKLVDINKVKYVTVASRNWGGYGSKDPNQTVNRDYSNLRINCVPRQEQRTFAGTIGSPPKKKSANAG